MSFTSKYIKKGIWFWIQTWFKMVYYPKFDFELQRGGSHATSQHSPIDSTPGRDGGPGPGRGRGRARLPGIPWDLLNDVKSGQAVEWDAIRVKLFYCSSLHFMWKHPKESSWSHVGKIQGIQQIPCGGNSWTKVGWFLFCVVRSEARSYFQFSIIWG